MVVAANGYLGTAGRPSYQDYANAALAAIYAHVSRLPGHRAALVLGQALRIANEQAFNATRMTLTPGSPAMTLPTLIREAQKAAENASRHQRHKSAEWLRLATHKRNEGEFGPADRSNLVSRLIGDMGGGPVGSAGARESGGRASALGESRDSGSDGYGSGSASESSYAVERTNSEYSLWTRPLDPSTAGYSASGHQQNYLHNYGLYNTSLQPRPNDADLFNDGFGYRAPDPPSFQDNLSQGFNSFDEALRWRERQTQESAYGPSVPLGAVTRLPDDPKESPADPQKLGDEARKMVDQFGNPGRQDGLSFGAQVTTGNYKDVLPSHLSHLLIDPGASYPGFKNGFTPAAAPGSVNPALLAEAKKELMNPKALANYSDAPGGGLGNPFDRTGAQKLAGRALAAAMMERTIREAVYGLRQQDEKNRALAAAIAETLPPEERGPPATPKSEAELRRQAVQNTMGSRTLRGYAQALRKNLGPEGKKPDQDKICSTRFDELKGRKGPLRTSELRERMKNFKPEEPDKDRKGTDGVPMADAPKGKNPDGKPVKLADARDAKKEPEKTVDKPETKDKSKPEVGEPGEKKTAEPKKGDPEKPKKVAEKPKPKAAAAAPG